jgi:hypothetical protein
MKTRSLARLTLTAVAFGALALGSQAAGAQMVRPMVQVKDISTAPLIEVIAWNATEPNYGLRSWVRRGGKPDRYHRFWVNKDLIPSANEINTAQSLDRSLPTTIINDTQNCYNGVCMPNATIGARFQDDLLRSSKADLLVTFYTAGGSTYPITVRKAVVDLYLVTMDSVIAAQKK